MKQLLLITVLIVAMTTKLLAQESKVIEVQNLGKETFEKGNNQFKIVAHESLDINLKFNLKKEDVYDVIISNNKNKIVLTRENYQVGENKIDFTMEEDEQYTVKLIGKKPTNLIVCVAEN